VLPRLIAGTRVAWELFSLDLDLGHHYQIAGTYVAALQQHGIRLDSHRHHVWPKSAVASVTKHHLYYDEQKPVDGIGADRGEERRSIFWQPRLTVCTSTSTSTSMQRWGISTR
jgi:hypothetical protein